MMGALHTPGFSDAARYIQETTKKDRRYLHDSNVFGVEGAVRNELSAVWEQCREPNWDAFGALPVSQDTLRNAYVLLESLPLGFPVPSVGAEPDGDLTFEWHRSTRRTLSISINSEGDLHYSGLFGPSRVYGTEAFFGDVPDSILNLIRRVYAA